MTGRKRRGETRSFGAVAQECGFSSAFAELDGEYTVAVEDALRWLAEERPMQQNHWPALTLAIVAQVQAVAEREGEVSFLDIFESNPPEATEARGKVVNTLNFRLSSGDSVKLRPLYNRTLHVIIHDMLREHPSNPGHATQSWPAYRPLIQKIGAMRPAERRSFVEALWGIAVLDKPARQLAAVVERVVRPFELVLREMPTYLKERDGGRGGAVFQAIAFGYLRADSPNLILESHGVNVGSKRAAMLGDVDGFRGQEPELAAEVKDLDLHDGNIWDQLGNFLMEIAEAPNVTAMVFCKTITPSARQLLEREGMIVLDRDGLARRVASWDVPKQQEALRGTEYYLGRIQKSAKLVQYFRSWLASKGIVGALGAQSTYEHESVSDG